MTMDMKTEVPAAIIDQLMARWFALQESSEGGLGSIDRAVNELRETVAGGPPYMLRIHDLVALSCYFDPANRAIIAPLLSAEAVAAADAVTETAMRLKRIEDAGFDRDQAVSIAVAEDELRTALPDAILAIFEGEN